MKKQFLYTGLAALLSLSASAQNADALKFSKAINKENGYKHLSVLASDEYEGREAGKKGAWMAADYIKKHFQSIGLKGPVKGGADPYFQKVDLATYTLGEGGLAVNGKAKELLKDFYITPATVSAQGFKINANSVLFAGYGLTRDNYNDFAGQDVAGKIVMIFAMGEPTPTSAPAATPAPTGRPARGMQNPLMAKLKYLVDNKAAGVLVINPQADNISPQIKNQIQNGTLLMKTEENLKRMADAATIPTIYIGTATANEILAAANTSIDAVKKTISDSGKPASQEIKIAVSANATKKENSVRGENVLGFLEGSDPKLKNEVLVLTGHYDHIGLVQDPNAKDKVNNGADDDGSGTTGVLLMAQAFMDAKKAGKGPKRSILFMTVVGEEKGLWGSDWYSQHPIFPVENTIANINTDMIGRVGEPYLGKPDSAAYVYSVGSFMLSTELGKIAEKVNAETTKLKLDYKFDDPKDTQRIYYRSDHYNFAKLGIPVIFYYDGMLEQDYHRPGDEVSKINFDLLAKRAQLSYYVAWELANRATRPVVDKNADGTAKAK